MLNLKQTTYSYDPASQVTQILHQLTATSSTINQADYAYNGMGNRTSLTDRRGAQTFGYDTLDRLTSASHPLLLDPHAFAYDAVGNRTTNGSVVNTGNQLTADNNFAYQYDDNGNLTKKTLLATENYTQYTYDAENRLTQVQEFAAGNPTAITTSSYRYDGLGRRIEKVGNGQTTRYIYDGEDILLEYDGANVLQAQYTHGPGIDEPLSRTVVTTGVSSGVTAVLASTADGLRGPVVDDTLVVNGQIFLGFVSGSTFLPSIGQPIDSTGSHLPVASLDVTAAAQSGTLTVALVDTATLSGNAPLYLVLREQATGRVLESRLLFSARLTAASTAQPGLPTVIASTTVPVSTPVATGTLFYHQDGLGTVTDLTDANGAVAKAYAYDAYGNILESPGTVNQPYTYTGREFDQETGLYYYRARYYDAAAGRFLQQDPLGFTGGNPNLYAYVEGNPSNLTDPDGEIPRPPRPPKPPKQKDPSPDKKGTPGQKSTPNPKPTCKLVFKVPPGGIFNPCDKCWSCTYFCTGRGFVGGPPVVHRYQIGGCADLKGPGYVPGFADSGACAAAAGGGRKDNPFEGLYPGDEP